MLNINYDHYGKVLAERAKRGMSVGNIHPIFQEKLSQVDKKIFDKMNNAITAVRNNRTTENFK